MGRAEQDDLSYFRLHLQSGSESFSQIEYEKSMKNHGEFGATTKDAKAGLAL